MKQRGRRLGIRLLLDEDSQAKALVNMLKAEGHDVLTVTEAGLESLDDSSVLAAARSMDRVLLTRNASDFQELHAESSDHPGILAVYRGPDPAKNMAYGDIARAIHNLESSSAIIRGQFVVLNAWRY